MFRRRSKLQTELEGVVRAAARPAAQFVAVPLAPDKPPPITATRFGGIPYAETGESWPVIAGHPCDFIAQFNLRECPNKPALNLGLITVFLSWHALESGDMNACVVRGYPDPSIEKAANIERPPACEPDDYQAVACAAQSNQIVTYPSPVNSFQRVPDIQRVARQFPRPHAAYRKALSRIGYQEDFGTRVGGYPGWIQDNTLDDENLMFVLQVGSESSANLTFGDAGCLFVAATKVEPIRFEIDPCQCF